MKIGELIAKLQQAQKENGDLTVTRQYDELWFNSVDQIFVGKRWKDTNYNCEAMDGAGDVETVVVLN